MNILVGLLLFLAGCFCGIFITAVSVAADQAEINFRMSFGDQCWTGIHYRWND